MALLALRWFRKSGGTFTSLSINPVQLTGPTLHHETCLMWWLPNRSNSRSIDKRPPSTSGNRL